MRARSMHLAARPTFGPSALVLPLRKQGNPGWRLVRSSSLLLALLVAAALLGAIAAPGAATGGQQGQGEGGLPEESLRRLQDEDAQVRIRGIRELQAVGTAEAAAHIANCLLDRDRRVQDKAIEALARCEAAPVQRWLRERGPEHRDPTIRRFVARALSLSEAPEAIEPLVELLEDREGPVAGEAARGLVRFPAERVLEPLIEATGARAWEPRAEALVSIAHLAPDRVGDLARAGLAAREYQVRMASLRALADTTADAAVEAGIHAVADDDAWQVKALAAQVLARYPRRPSIDALVAAMQEEDGRLLIDYSRALREITHRDLGADANGWNIWWTSNRDRFDLARAQQAAVEAGGGQRSSRLRYYDLEVLSKRLVFALDLSRSMNDQVVDERTGATSPRIDLARAELRRVIEGLDDDVRFNVLFFETDARTWQPRIFQATSRNKQQAFQYIMEQRPGGATNMFDALVRAFEDPDIDTVFMVGDGAPSEGPYSSTKTEFLAAVEDMNRYRMIHVHTVKIGRVGQSWQDFMRRLAEATGGQHVERAPGTGSGSG